jgi:ABC-type nickel/cobalt efflux system permease component RcnA
MFLLGMLHGLEPGHGKTIVASYLVGRRGYWVDAIYLGAVVAISHSAVIIALALVATFLGEQFRGTAAAEQCELASGVLVLALGFLMLRSGLRGAGGHHACGGCGHHHGPSPRPGEACSGERAGDDAPAAADHSLRRPSWRDLTALGIAGGIIPCPTSMAVLLGAASSGRLARGMALVAIFSLGVAAVLIAVGLLAVKAGDLARHWLENRRWTRYIPLATACLVLVLGLVLVGRSLLAGPAH